MPTKGNSCSKQNVTFLTADKSIYQKLNHFQRRKLCLVPAFEVTNDGLRGRMITNNTNRDGFLGCFTVLWESHNLSHDCAITILSVLMKWVEIPMAWWIKIPFCIYMSFLWAIRCWVESLTQQPGRYGSKEDTRREAALIELTAQQGLSLTSSSQYIASLILGNIFLKAPFSEVFHPLVGNLATHVRSLQSWYSLLFPDP